MIDALVPFAREGIGVFAVVVVAALFYWITTNMTKAFERGTMAFEAALEKIMINNKNVLDTFALESGKGHTAKIDEIHSLNEFLKTSMVQLINTSQAIIKENTLSNQAVVKEMEGVRTVVERCSLLLDRVERKMDGR